MNNNDRALEGEGPLHTLRMVMINEAAAALSALPDEPGEPLVKEGEVYGDDTGPLYRVTATRYDAESRCYVASIQGVNGKVTYPFAWMTDVTLSRYFKLFHVA